MWKSITIKDKNYAISSKKSVNVWKIYLTDFINIWMEDLQTQAIVQRCKELNPLLNVECLDVDKIMDEILIDIPQYADKVSENSKISLCKNIQGGRFRFEINLSKRDSEEYFNVITHLINLYTADLFRKYSTLLRIVQQKDDEIAEYKAEGAQLIRKNIETKPFNEDLFKLEQSKVNNFTSEFDSLLDLCNKAETLNLKKTSKSFSNSESPGKSTEVKDDGVEINSNVNSIPESSDSNINSNLPTNNKSSKSLEHKGKKHLIAKQGKRIISASVSKPNKKTKSRVTSFLI